MKAAWYEQQGSATFSLAEIAQAHEFVDRLTRTGRVVLTM